MKTCPNCESVSTLHLSQAEMSQHDSPKQAMESYNKKLEQLRADGYQVDPETAMLFRQCAECAAPPEENGDEAPST